MNDQPLSTPPKRPPTLASQIGAIQNGLRVIESGLGPNERFSFGWRTGNAMISYVTYLGMFFYPAGLALAGPLADAFGIATVLWVSAGVAILVSVFQLAWRDVRAPRDMGAAARS